jgi:hypothetical protein
MSKSKHLTKDDYDDEEFLLTNKQKNAIFKQREKNRHIKMDGFDEQITAREMVKKAWSPSGPNKTKEETFS